ncbi:MAG: hypothetical protein WBB38_05870 [Hyphomicrobiaceae bacterium]|jgi:hypothetical protein
MQTEDCADEMQRFSYQTKKNFRDNECTIQRPREKPLITALSAAPREPSGNVWPESREPNKKRDEQQSKAHLNDFKVAGVRSDEPRRDDAGEKQQNANQPIEHLI